MTLMIYVHLCVSCESYACKHLYVHVNFYVVFLNSHIQVELDGKMFVEAPKKGELQCPRKSRIQAFLKSHQIG